MFFIKCFDSRTYPISPGSKIELERKQTTSAVPGTELDQPPPLPPRPGRGNRPYPSKPIVQTQAKMTTLPWTRVILKDDGNDFCTSFVFGKVMLAGFFT